MKFGKIGHGIGETSLGFRRHFKFDKSAAMVFRNIYFRARIDRMSQSPSPEARQDLKLTRGSNRRGQGGFDTGGGRGGRGEGRGGAGDNANLEPLAGQSVMKKIKSKVEMEIDEEDKRGGVERKGRAVPSFSHFEPCVRKKGERKKLLGFECKQCKEYYKSKLEEGLTQDQILQMINNSSRHQGLCKPPLTLQDFGIL